MGRKVNWAEKPKKGPGRKARKQGPPTFPGEAEGKVRKPKVKVQRGKGQTRPSVIC